MPRLRTMPTISVGGGGGSLDTAVIDVARRVGAAIARAQANMLCGGLGGVMQEAARAYHDAGGAGVVIGLLPGEDAAAANPFVDIAIATGLGRGRNTAVALGGVGLIAVGGGGGTLSEIGLALQAGRRVAVLAVSGGAAERAAGFVAGASEGSGSANVAYSARDAEDAVRYVLGSATPEGAR